MIAGLLVISAAILTLEVLQTRIFSYSLPPVLVYASVGLALLGMGASGTALSLWSGWREKSLGSVCGVASAGFALSLVAAHALFARVSPQLADVSLGPIVILTWAALAVPYFLAGIAVTACLSAAGERVHLIYFVNLLGSALGCFTVFFLLEPLGAPALLAVVTMAAVAAAFLFGAGSGFHRLVVFAASAAAVTIATFVWPHAFYPFLPDPAGQLEQLRSRYAERDPSANVEARFESWDPTGRIEIHRFGTDAAALPDPVPMLFYSQDGDAGSLVFGVEEDIGRARGLFDRTLYGAGYRLLGDASGASVLVVGLGGGPDVLGALSMGAGSVTGVEINASAIRALEGPLARFAGEIYGRPNVEIVHMDGRSFVRSTDQRFDLIVMSGVDTKSVLAAGSLATNENHLYTVEAFGEYLDRLKPGGVLAFLRFGFIDRLRLAGIATTALRERGIAHPEQHFVVLEQGLWTSVLISLDPIETARVERISAWIDTVPKPETGIRLPVYEALSMGKADLGLNMPPRLLYPKPRAATAEKPDLIERFFEHIRQGTQASFFENFPFDVSPTTDDRPFFFDLQKRAKLLTAPGDHYRLIGTFLAIIGALAALAIVGPLYMLGRRAEAPAGRLGSAVYFTALGMGFIVLEISLVQKLVLFLGHQSYAITVVLASLLVSAGVGSVCAGALSTPATRLVRIAVPVILLLTATLVLGLDRFGPALASLPLAARIAIALGALFPLGFALGIPFPTGLRALSVSAPSLVPWAIGANGLASVVGSAAALPAAMLFGYRVVLIAACVLYVVAALSFPSPAARRRETD